MMFRLLALLAIGAAAIYAFIYVSKLQENKPNAAATTPYAYFGAYIPNGQRETWRITDLENITGKGLAIVHWYQGWGVTDGTQYFQRTWMDNIRSHGSIPMITWEPWDYTKGVNQPEYALANITSGKYDAYITRWALDSKAWGKPYFLRFAHEMNSSPYPWNENYNGNKPGAYIEAWRHVRDIFTANGVTNVTWVWNPNVDSVGTIPLSGLYPGDAYVDWVGIDGYNGGTALNWGGWLTFPQVIGPTYKILQVVAPNKPVIIGETASTETGGSKANWITDAFQTQIPNYYPKIKAVLWFNESRETDWRINSSTTSQSAFAAAIALNYYASNQYSSLTTSPIPGPESLITPTSAVSAISPTPTSPATDTPPSISISSPANGSTVSGKTKITASATDNIRVTKVDFYIDSKLVVSDTAAPFEYIWNTKSASKGAHVIKATAFDSASNSAFAQITVNR